MACFVGVLLCAVISFFFALGSPSGAPPFAFSAAQSVPCPAGSQDYILAETGGGAPLSPNEDEVVAKILDGIQPHVQKMIGELRSPSAGIIVVHQGKLLASRFAGTVKVGGTVPASGDTGYLIASITKTFTTVMMYKLRDEGKLPPLGIDAPLTALFPKFRIKSTFGIHGITLRNMAMHASGLPREGPKCQGCSTPPTTDEWLSRIAEIEVLSAPWQGTHYSNLGLVLLGRALEVAANKSWERYVSEDILEPLGMVGSGNPPWRNAALRDRMADGFYPDVQRVPPLPNGTDWGAPCGSMYSTGNDMAIWMSFLMDAGSDAQRQQWDKILSRATRTEMRNTGILQGDGLSAIGAGTFESAYFSGKRWGVNKMGCGFGYRSGISMVPSLGLGVFGVASSECDMFGDGDAVSFPIVSSLVPALESYLERRALFHAPLPSEVHAMTGRYCETAMAVENITSDDGTVTGRLLVARGPPGEYPFVLQYLGSGQFGSFRFRKVMGPEKWLPSRWTGCSEPSAPGLNLCPVSCFRKMMRGSGELTTIEKSSDGFYRYEGCKQHKQAFWKSDSADSVAAALGETIV